MAPSTTIGATILLCRKAATKVIIFHSPQGARPINSMPRGPRPQSRTILVVTAVSSINTSRAGSNIPCSSIQRRRAFATSARCCSCARRFFFFEGDAVALEEPCDRTLAGSYPALAQFGDGLLQGPVGLFSHQRQNLLRVSFQRRKAPSARLRLTTLGLVPTLQPPHSGARVNVKNLGSLPPRRSRLNRIYHAPPQVSRMGPWHHQPPKGENQCAKTRSSLTHWESRRFKSAGKPSSPVSGGKADNRNLASLDYSAHLRTI